MTLKGKYYKLIIGKISEVWYAIFQEVVIKVTRTCNLFLDDLFRDLAKYKHFPLGGTPYFPHSTLIPCEFVYSFYELNHLGAVSLSTISVYPK